MNQKQIISELEKLRGIAPEQAFFSRSKQTVLALRPEGRRVFGFKAFYPALFGGVIGFAVIAIGFFTFFSPAAGKPVYASLNSDNLNKELDSLTINIQLKEIRYKQSIDATINSALREVGNNETRHLNKGVLETEKNNLQFDEPLSNETINALLDEIIEP